MRVKAKPDVATYADWDRLVPDPDAVLLPWAMRADFVAWCSDRNLRPDPMSRQRAVVKARGGRVKGTGDLTHYLGVRLADPVPDSGYRVRTRGRRGGEQVDPGPLLAMLWDAGLVGDARDLDIAWLQLTGAVSVTCWSCGKVTRQPRQHRACES